MKRQAVFRKYSWDGKKQCLYPSYFEGIIEFTADGEINFKQGAFLTTNSFNSPQDAQKYLSITYCPSYLYQWGSDICSQIIESHSYEFKNVYGKRNSASRIWPTFGKHGGGCEIIMTKGELKCPPVVILDGGGGEDEFRQDSAKSDVIFSSWLVEILYEWFRGKKERDGDTDTRKTIRGKILDGLGTIIKWVGGRTKKR